METGLAGDLGHERTALREACRSGRALGPWVVYFVH